MNFSSRQKPSYDGIILYGKARSEEMRIYFRRLLWKNTSRRISTFRVVWFSQGPYGTLAMPGSHYDKLSIALTYNLKINCLRRIPGLTEVKFKTIQRSPLEKDESEVTLDITSLFTKVPHSENRLHN